MISYTGGTFDVLHVGHLELLTACRERVGLTGKVVVSLNTDAFIERYKGRPPVQPFEQRREILQALNVVDLVVRNSGDEDSGVAIDVVAPDVILIGSDWETKDYLGQLGVTTEWLRTRGLRIEYVPRTRGVSSSARRDAR